jgi:hypothetical protein
MAEALIFQWMAIVLGVVAAALWFFSAAVPVPEFEKIASLVSQGKGAPINTWAEKTASRNKWAAVVTGFAVLAQAAGIWVSRCAC